MTTAEAIVLGVMPGVEDKSVPLSKITKATYRRHQLPEHGCWSAIKALLADGLIQAVEENRDGDGTRLYYRRTAKGESQAVAA